MEPVARSAARRFGPRSFRGTIVASTVGLMTVSMIVVGLFIQLLLSRAADNDVDEVLHQRAETALAVIGGASATGLTVPQDSLEPGSSSTTRTARCRGIGRRRRARPGRRAGRGAGRHRPRADQ